MNIFDKSIIILQKNGTVIPYKDFTEIFIS